MASVEASTGENVTDQDNETVKSGTALGDTRVGSSLTCVQVLTLPDKIVDGLRYTPPSPAWHCAWSRDGRWLAACYGAPDPCIRIWQQPQDDAPWEMTATLQGVQTRTIRSIAFAPTLIPILASVSFDGTVAIWEYEDKEWECTAQLEGHDNEVKCVCWNATGSLLATCGRDKSVWLWECFLPGTVGGTDPVGNDAGGDFECLAVLNGHEQDVKCVVFAASHGQWGDGDEILLSGSYDDTIKVWAEDAGDWYCVASLAAHASTVWSLAVAPGSTRLISGSDDGSIGIFKAYTCKEKKTRFPDAEGGSNGLWKCVGKLPAAHASTVYSVDCAPARAGHGRIASAGADNCIQIYREALGSSSDQPRFSLDVVVTTDHGDVNCISWHPWDGSLLASAGDDGTVRLWRFRM